MRGFALQVLRCFGRRASCGGGPAQGSVGARRVLLEKKRWLGLACWLALGDGCDLTGFGGRGSVSRGCDLVAEDGGISAPILRFRGEGGGCPLLPEADLVALVRGSGLIRRDSEEPRRDLFFCEGGGSGAK